MKQVAVIHKAFENTPRLVAYVDVTKEHKLAEIGELGEYEATELMLEKAWELTNSIDHPWVQNKGVTVVGKPWLNLLRSTSVGDELVLNGEKWQVAQIGFTKVTGDKPNGA